MLLYICAGFIIYISWFLYWNLNRTLPGPTLYLPVIGHALQLGLNPLHYLKTLMRWSKQFDRKIFHLWVAGTYHVIISHPDDIEMVLSSTTVLSKGTMYKYLRPWIGDGLLTTESGKWHSHRKMITPSFHFQMLKEFLKPINKTSNKFVQKLKIESANKKIINVQEFVHKCTLDIICETAFGNEINSLDGQNEELVTALNDICYMLTERMYGALKRFDILYFFFPERYKLMKQLKVFQTYLTKIINERKKDLPKEMLTPENDLYNPKRKLTFLDNLLTARINDKPLEFQDIMDEVSTFMFAGQDTTASAISFFFFILSRHPHIQEKLYDEQMSFSNEPDWEPTFEEIPDMKYLDMCIKELLRVFPAVPGISRQAHAPMEINGQYIPTDTILVIFIMALCYNENIYENPCEFIPERFSAENRAGANPYHYIPFSAGPRNCIGQKYAMMEVKAVMSKVIRNFKILPPVDNLTNNGIFDMSKSMRNKGRTKWDPTMSAVLTLKSVVGVHVRLEPR